MATKNGSNGGTNGGSKTPNTSLTVEKFTTEQMGAGRVRQSIRAELRREYVAGGSTSWVYSSKFLTSLPFYIDDLTLDFGDDIYERMLLDGQVSSDVETLKLSVLSSGLVLTSAVSDDKAPDYRNAGEIREFCQKVIDGLETPIGVVMFEMLDAIALGSRVAELVYDVPEYGALSGKLVPRWIKTKPRHSVAFVVDPFNNVKGLLGNIPGTFSPMMVDTVLIDAMAPNLLPRSKFCILTNQPHNGDPRGKSILRPAYNPWWLKQMSFPDYLKYLATFAVPSLIGITGESATEEPVLDAYGQPVYNEDDTPYVETPQQAMLRTLVQLRNSSAAAFPYGSSVEPLEVKEGSAPYESFIDARNREISVAITGQTLSSMEGGHQSRAAAETHGDKTDLRVNYIKTQLEAMLRQDILRQIVCKNFSDEDAALYTPFASLSDTEPQDFAGNASSIGDLWSKKYLSPSQLSFTDKKLGIPARTEEELDFLTQQALTPPTEPGAEGAEGAPGADPAGKSNDALYKAMGDVKDEDAKFTAFAEFTGELAIDLFNLRYALFSDEKPAGHFVTIAGHPVFIPDHGGEAVTKAHVTAAVKKHLPDSNQNAQYELMKAVKNGTIKNEKDLHHAIAIAHAAHQAFTDTGKAKPGSPVGGGSVLIGATNASIEKIIDDAQNHPDPKSKAKAAKLVQKLQGVMTKDDPTKSLEAAGATAGAAKPAEPELTVPEGFEPGTTPDYYSKKSSKGYVAVMKTDTGKWGATGKGMLTDVFKTPEEAFTAAQDHFDKELSDTPKAEPLPDNAVAKSLQAINPKGNIKESMVDGYATTMHVKDTGTLYEVVSPDGEVLKSEDAKSEAEAVTNAQAAIDAHKSASAPKADTLSDTDTDFLKSKQSKGQNTPATGTEQAGDKPEAKKGTVTPDGYTKAHSGHYTIEHEGKAGSITKTPDGKYLASAGDKGERPSHLAYHDTLEEAHSAVSDHIGHEPTPAGYKNTGSKAYPMLEPEGDNPAKSAVYKTIYGKWKHAVNTPFDDDHEETTHDTKAEAIQASKDHIAAHAAKASAPAAQAPDPATDKAAPVRAPKGWNTAPATHAGMPHVHTISSDKGNGIVVQQPDGKFDSMAFGKDGSTLAAGNHATADEAFGHIHDKLGVEAEKAPAAPVSDEKLEGVNWNHDKFTGSGFAKHADSGLSGDVAKDGAGKWEAHTTSADGDVLAYKGGHETKEDAQAHVEKSMAEHIAKGSAPEDAADNTAAAPDPENGWKNHSVGEYEDHGKTDPLTGAKAAVYKPIGMDKWKSYVDNAEGNSIASESGHDTKEEAIAHTEKILADHAKAKGVAPAASAPAPASGGNLKWEPYTKEANGDPYVGNEKHTTEHPETGGKGVTLKLTSSGKYFAKATDKAGKNIVLSKSFETQEEAQKYVNDALNSEAPAKAGAPEGNWKDQGGDSHEALHPDTGMMAHAYPTGAGDNKYHSWTATKGGLGNSAVGTHDTLEEAKAAAYKKAGAGANSSSVTPSGDWEEQGGDVHIKEHPETGYKTVVKPEGAGYSVQTFDHKGAALTSDNYWNSIDTAVKKGNESHDFFSETALKNGQGKAAEAAGITKSPITNPAAPAPYVKNPLKWTQVKAGHYTTTHPETGMTVVVTKGFGKDWIAKATDKDGNPAGITYQGSLTKAKAVIEKAVHNKGEKDHIAAGGGAAAQAPAAAPVAKAPAAPVTPYKPPVAAPVTPPASPYAGHVANLAFDKKAPASDVAGGDINGVGFAAPKADFWLDHKDTDAGANVPFDSGGLKKSSGVILVEPDGKIWIHKVANKFDGYDYTFSKGGVEKGLTPQQNALKETFEEQGLQGEIHAHLGDFKGNTSMSRYYVGKRTGGDPNNFDSNETDSVHLVTPEEAYKLLNVQRDKDILKALQKHIADNGVPLSDSDKNPEAEAPHVTYKGQKLELSDEKLTDDHITNAKEGVSESAKKYLDQAKTAGTIKTVGDMHQFLSVAEAHSKASGKDYVSGYGMQHAIAHGGSIQKLTEAAGKGDAEATKTVKELKTNIGAPTATDKAKKAQEAAKEHHGQIVAAESAEKFKTGGAKHFLAKKLSGQKGGNDGGLYESSTGDKHYVKFYKNPEQAHSEHVANAMYKALGGSAPESTTFEHNGGVAYASKYLDHKGHMGSDYNEARAQEMLKGFAADVLMSNHDAMGATGDNTVKNADGTVTRLDNGGAFKFRATGKLKEKGLDSIREWDNLANPSINPKYAAVFKKAGYASADKIPGISSQIAAIEKLKKEHGGDFTNFVKTAAPSMPAAQQKELGELLNKRSELLIGKKQELIGKASLVGTGPGKRTFTYKPNGHEEIKKLHKASVSKNMTAEQKQAITWFKSDGYDDMNDVLRKGKPASPKVAKAIKDLNDAFAHPEHVMGQDLIISRKVHLSGDAAAAYHHGEPGTVIPDPGGQSHSLHSTLGWPGNTHFKVHIPKEAKAIAPTIHTSAHAGENEVLLPPGTTYRILSSNPPSQSNLTDPDGWQWNSGWHQVTVEVVVPGVND